MTNETKYPATCIVHWASGPVACCEDHARTLISLGNMLGSHVVATKLNEDAECSTCISEKGDTPQDIKNDN